MRPKDTQMASGNRHQPLEETPEEKADAAFGGWVATWNITEMRIRDIYHAGYMAALEDMEKK